MGFSIGRFLKSVATNVLSAVPILGPAITSGFGRPSSVGPTVFAQQPQFPQVSTFGTRMIPKVIGAAAGAFRASPRFRRSAILLARELGISAAAVALGITVIELAEIVSRGQPRRRRGITASQISTTKATIRRVNSLHRAIADVCPPPARRRRAPSRAAIHHAK